MMTRCFNRIMVEPKARPLSIKARVRIDYFPINTDLDSDYSYYTPNAAVVTAVCGSIYKILQVVLTLCSRLICSLFLLFKCRFKFGKFS